MGVDKPRVPDAVVSRLRRVCLDLPDVTEEEAWVGTRWTVRGKNFAHVLMVAAGWPPAYARAARLDGPACVLTFRAPPAALRAPRFARSPFFLPPWWPDVAGMVLEEDAVDWEDVEALVTQSYCALAPKKLARQVAER